MDGLAGARPFHITSGTNRYLRTTKQRTMSAYREGYKLIEAIQQSASHRGLLVRKDDDNWNLAHQVAYTYGRNRTQQGTTGERIVTVYMELFDEWGYSDDESNMSREAKAAKYQQEFRLQYIETGIGCGYLTFSRLK